MNTIITEFLAFARSRGVHLAKADVVGDTILPSTLSAEEEQKLAADFSVSSTDELTRLRGETARLRIEVNKARRGAALLDKKRKKDLTFALGWSPDRETPEASWQGTTWEHVLNRIISHRCRDVSRHSLHQTIEKQLQEIRESDAKLEKAKQKLLKEIADLGLEAEKKDSFIGKQAQELARFQK